MSFNIKIKFKYYSHLKYQSHEQTHFHISLNVSSFDVYDMKKEIRKLKIYLLNFFQVG